MTDCPRWVRCVVLGLALFLATWLAAPGARAAVIELHEARVSTVAGSEPAAWQPTTLPYHWDRERRGQNGEAHFEVPFSFTQAVPSEPYGLYFPAVGNAAEISLNGKLLARYGDIHAPNTDDYAKAPRYVAVPPAMLQKDNLLGVVVRADAGRRGGLSAVSVGPVSEMRDTLFSRAFAWRVTGSLLLSMLSLLVAFVALTFWFTQSHRGPDGRPRRDSVYLWAGLAELSWTLRVADALIEVPPLPWPYWGVVVSTAYAGWICGVLLFCHHVAGWREHRSMRWMHIAMAAMFLSCIVASWLTLARHQPIFLTVWLGVASLVCVVYSCVYFALMLRSPNLPRCLVAIAGMLNVAVGVRDWFVIRVSDSFGVITWNRYVSLFFGLALLYIVALRFREASNQARELLATLESRIARREEELAGTYQRLEEVAREQARAHERERILRDMHDGVGSVRPSGSCRRARPASPNSCAPCEVRSISSSSRSIRCICQPATWGPCWPLCAIAWSRGFPRPGSSSSGPSRNWHPTCGSTRKPCVTCSSCCSRPSPTFCSMPRPRCFGSRPPWLGRVSGFA